MGHTTLLIRDADPGAAADAAAERPANLIAAVFVDRGGTLTLDVCGQQLPVPGLLTTCPALRRHLNQRVLVAIGPEHLHDASIGLPPAASSTASVLHGTVRGVRPDGADRLLDVEVADAAGWLRPPRLVARVDPRCTAETGDAVMLAIDLRHLRVFDAATGRPL